VGSNRADFFMVLIVAGIMPQYPSVYMKV